MQNLQALIPELGKPAMQPVLAVGIDLGTTFSSIAQVVADTTGIRARCLEVPYEEQSLFSDQLVPSAVAMHGKKVVVGQAALDMQRRATQLGLEQNRDLFYECKNDMGLRRTYYRAPQGFRTPAEIGGRVISFLLRHVQPGGSAAARTVVTVPASFLAAGRSDTIAAAKAAGLTIAPGDLLDEPLAAFIDYLVNYDKNGDIGAGAPKTVLVFDFGGGTCDVAVFRVAPDARSARLCIAPLSVSRYHRLGGGDIDAAIAYEILLPQFCKQNGIDIQSLDYDDKKLRLEPFLKPVAEKLKVACCANAGAQDDKRFELPISFTCRLDDRTRTLDRPGLAGKEFARILEPFLDGDVLCAGENDYRLTNSIFAPITDALDRCAMRPTAVDLVLLAGGSSLIPQVQNAVAKFFVNARLLTFPDALATQTAVARGAAYHALALAVTGKGIVAPVCQDAICMLTDHGPVEIVPQGVELPYPAHGRGVMECLSMPAENLLDTFKLRVALSAGADRRPLYESVWNINGVVNKGDPLRLSYRYDENQVLSLSLSVADGLDHGEFAAHIEHPLTHIVNPDRLRLRILALEEDLADVTLDTGDREEMLEELADLYAQCGKRERSITIYKSVLRLKNCPDPDIINRMAMLYGEIGNRACEERLYRQAIAANRAHTAAWFNLALLQERAGRLDEALSSINEALNYASKGPYQALRSQLLRAQGQHAESQRSFETAFRSFGAPACQSSWELGWYRSVAETLGKTGDAVAANQELIKRKTPEQTPAEGALPAMAEG